MLWTRQRLADYRCVSAQAPAANHKGTQQALEQTFTLTNISPQVGKGFNRCCHGAPATQVAVIAASAHHHSGCALYGISCWAPGCQLLVRKR